MTAMKNTKNHVDFSDYQQQIVNNLGYFAMTRTRIEQKSENGSKGNEEYFLDSSSIIARMIYWFAYVNTGIKAVFLAFLVADYFGPVLFLDKIAALDYILCVGIVTFGSCIWFVRYPLHEILHGFWKIENSIFKSLDSPEDLKSAVARRQSLTVWIHLCIVWFGCIFLLTQFYSDPKYCAWTYSAFEVDTWYLRIIFCAHEFFFMMHPWNNMTGNSSLCTFQGVALSSIIDRMTRVLSMKRNLESDRMRKGNSLEASEVNKMNNSYDQNEASDLKHKVSTDKHSRSSTSNNLYENDSVYKLIFDYKMLMIISEQFNSWVSYKIVFLHACGYCQFISDVFVAMQVLKIPGAGFLDVWFYIEDSLASMFVIYWVYKHMSLVELASLQFLRQLNLFTATDPGRRKHLLKVKKTLKAVSLKLGPCPVTPMTVLLAMEMLGNYYICVAMWK